MSRRPHWKPRCVSIDIHIDPIRSIDLLCIPMYPFIIPPFISLYIPSVKLCPNVSIRDYFDLLRFCQVSRSNLAARGLLRTASATLRPARSTSAFWNAELPDVLLDQPRSGGLQAFAHSHCTNWVPESWVSEGPSPILNHCCSAKTRWAGTNCSSGLHHVASTGCKKMQRTGSKRFNQTYQWGICIWHKFPGNPRRERERKKIYIYIYLLR
jgi:hypothetical protein